MASTSRDKLSLISLSILSLIAGLLLIGKDHFLLGSLLGLTQYILIGLGVFLIIRRHNKGFKLIHSLFLIIVAGVFIHAIYDHAWRLRWMRPVENPKEISILSSNLFFKNKHKQNIVNEIEQNPTDLLFVQELTPSWKSTLAPLVHKRYTYHKEFISKYTYGSGIYSSYPILSSKFLQNSANQPFCHIVEVKIQEKKVVFVNIHLASPAIAVENPEHFYSLYQQNAKDRAKQMKEIEAYLKENHKTQTAVMVGDLNTPRLEPLYRITRHHWADLHKKVGWGMGWTFPNVGNIPFPFITLDYILYRGSIKGKKFKVLPNSSSDHLSIWGVVEI